MDVQTERECGRWGSPPTPLFSDAAPHSVVPLQFVDHDELTGHPEATEHGLAALRTGGTAVLVGATYPARPLRLEAETLVRRVLTIRGLHNYTHDDLARAVAFLAAHHDDYPFADVVHDGFSLAAVEAAFEAALAGRSARVAVRP